MSKSARWALLFSNFVIGTGAMSLAGMLNDISRSLAIPVPVAGQLIAVSAVVMCVGAPLMISLVGRWERRSLLVLAMLCFSLGHLLCALAPNLAWLLLARAVTMVGAAVLAPQTAAVAGALAAPHRRGRAITFVFLGWSIASVLGLPLAAWASETVGWRTAMACISVFGFMAAAWLYKGLPAPIRPPAMTGRGWLDVLRQPALMGLISVTALQATGQFTLLSYFAPYFASQLGTSASELGALLLWFGVFGLVGNVWVSRTIDRTGPDRLVVWSMALMAVSMLLWPLGVSLVTMALVMLPWALGGFASNSAQQARLGHALPAMAPALMALNTSALHLGQAIGAASGGWLVATGPAGNPYTWLSWVAALWMIAAIVVSQRAARAWRRTDGAPPPQAGTGR